MLLSTEHIQGFQVDAEDGQTGKVESLLFDDETWIVRYLLVKTGRWFGREVILHPEVVGPPDGVNERLPVALTSERIKASPPLDVAKPVSRQYLEALAKHYGWADSWRYLATPVEPVPIQSASPTPAPSELSGDPHLRSTAEVIGYTVTVTDGEVGRVADFIFEHPSWEMRWIVVELSAAEPRTVLLSPTWTEAVDWPSRSVGVDMSRALIERSPAFDPASPVNREYEEVLYDYYARPVDRSPVR